MATNPDIRLLVGVDTGLSYNSMKDGISEVVKRLNDNPPKIKLSLDSTEIDNKIQLLRSQITEIGNQKIYIGATGELQGTLGTISNSLEVLSQKISGIGESANFNNLAESLKSISPVIENLKSELGSLQSATQNFQGINLNIGLGGSNAIARNSQYSSSAKQTLARLKEQALALEEVFKQHTKITNGFNAVWTTVKGTDILKAKDIFSILQGMNTPKTKDVSWENLIQPWRDYIQIMQDAAKIRGIDITSVTSSFTKSADEMIENTRKVLSGEAELESSVGKLKSIFGSGINSEMLNEQLNTINNSINGVSSAIANLKLDGGSLGSFTESVNKLSGAVDNLISAMDGVVNRNTSISKGITSVARATQSASGLLGKYTVSLNEDNRSVLSSRLTGLDPKKIDEFVNRLGELSISAKSVKAQWEDSAAAGQKLAKVIIDGSNAEGDLVRHATEFNKKTGDISREVTEVTHKAKVGLEAVDKEVSAIKSKLNHGDIEASIEKAVSRFEKLGNSGASNLQQIKDQTIELRELLLELKSPNVLSDDKKLISVYQQLDDLLQKTINQISIIESKTNTTKKIDFGIETKKFQSDLDAVYQSYNKLNNATDTIRANLFRVEEAFNTLNNYSSTQDQKIAAYERLKELIPIVTKQIRIQAEEESKAIKIVATNSKIDFGIDTEKFKTDIDVVQKNFDKLKNTSTELYATVSKNLSDLRGAFDTVTDTSTSRDKRVAAFSQLTQLLPVVTKQVKSLVAEEEKSEAAIHKREREKNQALKESLTLLKQIEQAETNWTAAKNGKSRGEYSSLSVYASDLRKYITQLESGTISAEDFVEEINRIGISFQGTESIIKANGEAVKSFGERVKTLGEKFSTWFSVSRVIMSAYSNLKKMVSASIELDNAMNQLQIVTKESDQTMGSFGTTAAESAKRIGSSITDFVSSATTYARLGYSLNESSQLAEFTAMLQNVGDIDVSEAQDAITSIVKAFNIGTDQIESVMDKMVVAGNNFPISVSQIAEGMKNASSALAAAGNSFDQSVALLTAANTTIQDASKSSTGLRTIAARIRKTKTELDELGETISNADYEKLVKTLTDMKVALTDNGEYRSTYDILKDISAQWENLTSMEQAALTEALAGTRQQAVFTSIIGQFQEASGAIDAMASSAGALQKAYDTRMQSTQAHINQFNASFQELSSTLINSNMLKFAIDTGTALVSLANGLQKVHLLLPSIIGMITVIKGIRFAKSLSESASKVQTLIAATLKEKVVTDSLAQSVSVLTLKEKQMFVTNVQNAVASKDLTAEEGRQILTTLGLATADGTLTVANKGLAGSFKTLMASIPVWGWVSLGVSMLAEGIVFLTSQVDNSSESVKNFETAFKETQNEILQISNEYKNLKESADEVIPRFVKLAKGVDDFGKKVSLTDEEYKEFLSLNNKIAEMFPQLSMGMDDNGNYILALSYSADTLRESLEELLEVQRQEANEAMAKKMPQNISDIIGVTDEYSKQIEEIESRMKIVQSGKFSRFLEAGDLNFVSNIQAKKEYDEFVDYLRSKGIEVQEIVEQTIGGTTYKAVWEQTSEQAINFLTGGLKQVADIQSRIASKWKSINPSIIAWLQTDYLYKDMNPQMQLIAQTMTKYLDFNELGLVSDDGEETSNNIKTYITKYIINPLYSSSDEVKTAFKDSMSLFESGEISETEFADRMKSAFDKLKKEMDDSEVTKFANAFIKGFNAMGMAGDDFDSVVDSLVKSWGKFSDSTPADSKSLIDLSKATEKLKSNYEIIQKAQKEMYGTTDENAGISADTIESLASATDDYLDYLYEENGVVKLNIEKWKEYSSQGMRDSIEYIENEIKQLEDRNDNISEGIELAKMYQDEVNMAKELGVTANNTIFGNIDTNNRQVLEWNKESLQKFKNAYESWGWTAEELEGTISTVLGNHDNFDGIDIAFTPMLQTKDGAVLLDYNTVHEYIWGLIDKAGEDWTSEDVLKLDTEGLEFDGVLIKNLIAGIGDEAEKVSRQMHFTGTDGSLNLGISELSSYAKEFYNITVVADDYSGELSKTQMRVSDFCKYINGFSSKIDENSDSIKSNQDLLKLYKGVLNSIVNDDELNATIVRLKNIQESLKNISSAITTLITLKDEINKYGSLSASSIEKIMSDNSLAMLRPYINDVKSMMPIITALIDDQKSAYEDLYNEQQRLSDPDAYIEASREKQREDENAFQNSIKRINEQVSMFNEKYGVDLSNWEKIEDGKKSILQNTNAELLSKQLKLINSFSEYYNTDLDNYKNTTAAKAAILKNFRDTEMFSQATKVATEKGLLHNHQGTIVLNGENAQKEIDNILAPVGLTWKDYVQYLNSGTFTKKGEELIKKQLDEIVKAYTISSENWENMTADIGGSSSSGGSKSKRKTWFEEQYNYHNHLVKMEQETEKDYLDWLDGAYKKAYNQGIIDLDTYYKYEEEVYNGRKKLTGESTSWFEKQYKEHQHRLKMETESEEDYLGWLESAYKNAYSQGLINLDEYRKYQEEVYEGRKKIFEKQYKAHQHYLKMEKEDQSDYLKWLDSAYKQAYKERLITLDEYKKYQEEVYEGIKQLKNNAESAIKELINIRINMLKEDVNKEKEAIKKKLDYLKDFYQKQKDMLQDKYDEEKYLEEQAEKRKSVSDIQAEMNQLRFDNSAWAQKRRIELQKDLTEAQKNLKDFEKDHALNDAKDRLDKLYEQQEKALNDQSDALDKKINNPQELYQQALNDIRNGSQSLYQQMIEWNNVYGDGIRDTIKNAWEEAYKAEKQYFNYTGRHYNGVNLSNATLYVKGRTGYASGTSHSTAGLHKVDEQGIETIFQSSDGQRYRMFSSGEKVLNAGASDFLYKFANKGTEILGKLFGNSSNNVFDKVHPVIAGNEFIQGDIIINGNADRATVSEIRRAQRESLEQMLKQFNRLK